MYVGHYNHEPYAIKYSCNVAVPLKAVNDIVSGAKEETVLNELDPDPQGSINFTVLIEEI